MRKKQVVMVLIAIIAFSFLGAAWLANEYQRRQAAMGGKIAIIYVEGVIIGGRGQTGLLNQSGGTDNLIKQLRRAKNDAAVKAVVLRINSPGGSAAASQEVGEELQKLRAAGKIVVTSMGDIATSGGYWLAASTDKIYANPSTITGSIGVYMTYTNLEELYEKIGIYQEKIKSGPHKDILAPERSMTADERAIIQGMVDDIYNQFLDVVATGRNLDRAKVRELADGRIYTGQQAKALGLVDELGNMYDAIEGAAQLAGIKGEPEIIEYSHDSPLAKLLGAVNLFAWQQLLSPLPANTISGVPLALPRHLVGEIR